LNVKYSSEQLKSAINKVDEALKKQEISHNSEQIFQVLREVLNTQVEHSDFSSTGRSGSPREIGEQLAQIMASNTLAQVKKPLSGEEEPKKQKDEKYRLWRKLYNDFRIEYVEVDSLMAEHSLEDLKVAISNVEEEFKDQENPQESDQMIQILKKHLNLT
jgi:hypothetical protein